MWVTRVTIDAKAKDIAVYWLNEKLGKPYKPVLNEQGVWIVNPRYDLFKTTIHFKHDNDYSLFLIRFSEHLVKFDYS